MGMGGSLPFLLTFNACKISFGLADLNFSAIILVASSAITDSFCNTSEANKSMASKSTSSVEEAVARSAKCTQTFLRFKTSNQKQITMCWLSLDTYDIACGALVSDFRCHPVSKPPLNS